MKTLFTLQLQESRKDNFNPFLDEIQGFTQHEMRDKNGEMKAKA